MANFVRGKRRECGIIDEWGFIGKDELDNLLKKCTVEAGGMDSLKEICEDVKEDGSEIVKVR